MLHIVFIQSDMTVTQSVISCCCFFFCFIFVCKVLIIWPSIYILKNNNKTAVKTNKNALDHLLHHTQ